MITLKILTDFVKETKFSDKHIKLNTASTIINQRKFAEAHLRFLLGNPNNKAYLPYYNRLVKFYNIINNTKNENKNNQESSNQKT